MRLNSDLNARKAVRNIETVGEIFLSISWDILLKYNPSSQSILSAETQVAVKMSQSVSVVDRIQSTYRPQLMEKEVPGTSSNQVRPSLVNVHFPLFLFVEDMRIGR